jgi:hypothetical protein
MVNDEHPPVNAQWKIFPLSKVEMSLFAVIFFSKAAGKRQRVKPYPKARDRQITGRPA